MSKPKVFVLSLNRHVGGAEKSIAALLPALQRQAEITVFVSSTGHRADLERLNCPGMEIVSVPLGTSPVTILKGLWRVWREARDRAPEALLANGHRGLILLFLLRWLPLPGRPRFAVYVRDFAYKALRFTLWALRDFLFLAPTAAIYEHPEYQNWGLTKRHHRVLSNTVPIPTNTEPAPGEPRFIGCCARLVPWKGIEYLIQSFGKIAAQHPDINVRIYGEPIDPVYCASLTKLTADLGLTQRIEFRDFAPDLGVVYRQGLFFVIPSLSILPGPESFSRIIIEAWAHSRPVVAFACGGPLHLIQDGEDGYLVEERNVDQLADRLNRLLSNDTLRERQGAAGAARVRAQFAPDAIAEQLLHLLLSGKPAEQDLVPVPPSAAETAS